MWPVACSNWLLCMAETACLWRAMVCYGTHTVILAISNFLLVLPTAGQWRALLARGVGHNSQLVRAQSAAPKAQTSATMAMATISTIFVPLAQSSLSAPLACCFSHNSQLECATGLQCWPSAPHALIGCCMRHRCRLVPRYLIGCCTQHRTL